MTITSPFLIDGGIPSLSDSTTAFVLKVAFARFKLFFDAPEPINTMTLGPNIGNARDRTNFTENARFACIQVTIYTFG